MVPQQKSKASAQQRSEREIYALLKRLHSGCRCLQFEDVKNKNDISNILRNAAQPDEVHSELGRALAHSYIASLDDDVGERILLSLCCGEDIESSNQQTDKTNYASVANAFFSYLAEYCMLANKNNEGDNNISADQERQQQILSKWLQWCVRCEELTSPADGSSVYNGGGRYVLIACLQHYSSICFVNSSSTCGCDMVYRSLKRSTSRKYWIRSVASAFELAITTTLGGESDEESILFQSFYPLFDACVLQARGSIQLRDLEAHNEECRLILNESLRICTMNLHKDSTVCQFSMKMIEYLTISLASYLDQIVYTSTNTHESVAVLELSYEWLRGLSDLIRSASTKDLDDDNTKSLTTAIDTIIGTILPQLSSSTSSFPVVFDLTSIYATIECSVNTLEQYSTFTTANSVAAMRLGTLALSLKSDREVNGVCGILLSIFSCFTYEETIAYNDISFVGGIMYALGCVFSSRPKCANKALTMKQAGEKLMQRIPSLLELSSSSCFSLGREENSHLIDLLAKMKSEPLSTNYQHLVDVISESISDADQSKLHSWKRRPLALEDQCSGLLVGLTLLHMSVMSPSLTEHGHQRTLEFLASFLECYPRAASRVLPSVLDTVRMSSRQSSPLPHILTSTIKFVASKPILFDPHGAHLSWTYLSPLTNDGIPTATRASIIRILPQMCLNNKKLFRRIRDVIGKSMVSTDPMVRIAATATLSDMAKLDLLRDVEGIVSWIQGRLIDEESTVTYFALSTLRYLVQNGELDFDLVIRVLEKRLAIDLGAVDDFLGWDILALEGLVELLGEGGLEEDDDDEESRDEEEEEEGGPEPTAKTVKAVSLLIELAMKIESDEHYDLSSQTRILSKIYQSLANYSALILGLDSESIRTCADATYIPEDLSDDWERYLKCKTIVQGGMNLVTRMQDEAKDGNIDSITTELSNNLLAMLRLLLSFEQETFGSFVFRKGSSSSTGNNEGAHQHRVSNSVLSALPEISTVKSIFESDESASARAAAYFYALGVEDDNGPVTQTSALLAEMTECISYFAPPDDPPAYAIQVFSIINAMSAAFRSIQNANENSREQLFETAVEQLEEWATEVSEYGYVALSALALAADDSPQFYSGISRVQNIFLDGCDMFETEDVKLLCTCMVAARLSRTTDARVVELIDSVEKSIEHHNSQSCFGGYLGLAIFVQSVSSKIRSTGSDPSEMWCREQALRCICILVKSLNNCILTQDDSILELVSCIETGKSTDALSLPSELIIKDGATQKLRGAIIGLSHCFPALADVSTHSLKAVVAVIDELPWGSGKGFATHATYKTLLGAGVYSPDDLSGAITDAIARIQDFDSDCIDLSDSLFSLVSLCRLSPGKMNEELDLVNETTETILSATSRMSSKGKTMAVFTRCASIGELPGVTSFSPNIHSSAKKDQVSNVVGILEETLLNGEVECTHASALALGVLCAMRNSSQSIQQHKHVKKSDRKNVDVNSIIQGKGGTVIEFVLQQVAKAHSDILVQHSDTKRASKQLCFLFEALETVSLPGSFSRVIETTLYSSAVDGRELSDSALQILFSQIESGRRRIGFDGRGFLDLSTRLTKLPTQDLSKLVGTTGAQRMVAAMPNLLFQLPTSTGEEVAKCLWGICRGLSNHQMVMTEFFIGMKTIFDSAEKESKDKSKLSTSPALLRALQNMIASGLFNEFCEVVAQSSKIDASLSSYSTSIAAYLECLDIISSSAITTDTMGIQSDVSYNNVLLMASCASLSSKQTRRVETWIARQNLRDNSFNLRMLLLSSLAVAPQSRNDIEMKESIVNLFDIMLVAGINTTLCVELIAAKVAYWWDSRNMNEISAATHPIQRVSTMSSFLISSNLCFEVQSLPDKEISTIFDLFVADLPAKLALLCHAWKISDDISNRATRLCKDATDNKKACLERIIQLLDGGGE